jgi:hypothetical protein
MDGLIGKSTSARIRRWTIRRDQLRKMAEAPHATSGAPAVSLDDTGTSLKADQHVEKAEEKQTKGVKRHGLGDGGEQRKKKQRQQRQPRKHSYHTRDDGQPPEMSQIHVDFAQLSAAYINANPICRTSFCKTNGSVEMIHGSVEMIATILPGNVHTALKRHAALRLLLIQLVQTNRVSNNSKPKN